MSPGSRLGALIATYKLRPHTSPRLIQAPMRKQGDNAGIMRPQPTTNRNDREPEAARNVPRLAPGGFHEGRACDAG